MSTRETKAVVFICDGCKAEINGSNYILPIDWWEFKMAPHPSTKNKEVNKHFCQLCAIKNLDLISKK